MPAQSHERKESYSGKLDQQAVSRQGLQIHSANTRGKLTNNNNKSNCHHNNMHKESEIRNPGRDKHEIPFRDLRRLKWLWDVCF